MAARIEECGSSYSGTRKAFLLSLAARMRETSSVGSGYDLRGWSPNFLRPLQLSRMAAVADMSSAMVGRAEIFMLLSLTDIVLRSLAKMLNG